MRNWFIKVKTADGAVFVCDCDESNVAAIIDEAYDHFGMCAVTARPL